MQENTVTALTLTERAKAIDVISSRALEAFASAESFEKELCVAQAVVDLRVALSPEVMQPIMGLMNTSLGFRTDKDPSQLDKTGQPNKPYPVEVVREAFIESRLRGFHSVGNEWNIIAGRWYGCVAGFERMVRHHPKVTDVKDTYGVPHMSGDRGAIVKANATWRQDGTPQSIEREFAVRVNGGMGADAIVGKAKRKLFAAIHARLTGVVTPEGEAGDDPINVQATATPVDAATMFKKPEAATTPAPFKPQIVPDPAPAPAQPHPTPQAALAQVLLGAGYTFDDFAKWSKDTGALAKQLIENCQSYADVPADLASRFVKASAGMLKGIAKITGKAPSQTT